MHVVRGALMGLVLSNPKKIGKYVNFHVSRFWVTNFVAKNEVLTPNCHNIKISNSTFIIV